MNELELIEKAKKGNQSALNTLLCNNADILKGYIVKMTGDIHLSQDIIQDTMIKAVLNIDKFEPKAKFSTWLIKIATNAYRDFLRKNKKFELIEDTLEDRNQRVEEIVISKDQYNEILNVVLKLSPEKRAVFILKHYHELKYEEIAEIMNCPIGTVRSRLHHAVKYIVNELERKEML